MDASADKPQVRPLGLSDCYGMIATTVCWLFITGALAVSTLQQLPPSLAVKIFFSSLCGPFAFFEHEANRPPLHIALVWALICLTPVGVHLLTRRTVTAVLAGLGISWWFLLGLGLTFISV